MGVMEEQTVDPAVVEAFDRLRTQLDQPGAWIQGPSARSKTGRPVDAWSKRAVCWCLFGALQRTGQPEYGEMHKILNAEAIKLGSAGIIDFNETPGRTQAEVLDLIDRTKAQYVEGAPTSRLAGAWGGGEG